MVRNLLGSLQPLTRSCRYAVTTSLLRSSRYNSTAIPKSSNNDVKRNAPANNINSGPTESPSSGDNPWSSTAREDVLGGTGDGKTSFDIYSDMNIPLNSVKSLLGNGFLLESGQSVITADPKKPQVMVLLGTEAFQLDGSKITGLDTGIVEIDSSLLEFLKVTYPRPEMLLIGLGDRSRILGPKTQKLLQLLGVRHHLSRSRSAASSFNLLAMERGQEVAGFFLTPDV